RVPLPRFSALRSVPPSPCWSPSPRPPACAPLLPSPTLFRSRFRTPVPLLAAFAEFVVVWAWHAPAAHAFARGDLSGFLLEQASFVACALLLWAAVADAARRREPGAEQQRAGDERSEEHTSEL